MRIFLMATVLLVGAEQARAQYSARAIANRTSPASFTANRMRNQVFSRAVPTSNFGSAKSSPFTSSVAPARRDKPFSSIVKKPTVSPYMGMVGNNPFTSTTDNYFNIVRPQLEQQKANQQLAARNIQMQRQLNDIAARGPYNPEGAEDRAPTGHGAVYMNYGGYYTPSRPVGISGRR